MRAFPLIWRAKTPMYTAEASLASCFRDCATRPLSLPKKKQETGRSIPRVIFITTSDRLARGSGRKTKKLAAVSVGRSAFLIPPPASRDADEFLVASGATGAVARFSLARRPGGA